jgi:hypothetical protein
MIDHFTYVVIKNGKPTLKKLRDDSLEILSKKDYFQMQSEEMPFLSGI